LIIENMQWVRALAAKMCKKAHNSRFDLEDLVQEGLIGLMAAARVYDPERNSSFQAFAIRRVQGAMMDFMRRQSWPRKLREIRRAINEARDKFVHDNDREPALEELARAVGCSADSLAKRIAHIAAVEVFSTGQTDAPACAASLVSDLFRESVTPDYDSAIDGESESRKVRQALGMLDERDRQIVRSVYFDGVSQKEVAAALGVVPSRVSQICRSAIGNMAAHLAA
jgi:RNA polymerase sigma factor for flagellar operon FliA